MTVEFGALRGKSILAGVLVATLALGGCGKGSDTSSLQQSDAVVNNEEGETTERLQATFYVTREMEYGSIDIHVNGDEFHELGFDFGDSLDLVFSNGYELLDLPYYNGFYTKAGEPLVLAYPGYEYLWAAINSGESLFDVAGLSDGDTVTITLNEKGKYADIQNARDVTYTNSRDDYESDEVFANFRNMCVGNMLPGLLYRSSSECNPRYGRASYVDRLAEESGIKCAIDLADGAEKVEEYLVDEDFESDYFKGLLEDDAVVFVGLQPGYNTDGFHTKLANGLVEAMDRPTPWLVFCNEGKDRTGTVCMILEALAGATYEEVEKDYMTTYANYYGITKEGDPNRYYIIVRDLFHPMIAALFDQEEVDVESVDLEEGAKNFLAKGGMTEGQIHRLKGILTGTITAGEVAE